MLCPFLFIKNQESRNISVQRDSSTFFLFCNFHVYVLVFSPHPIEKPKNVFSILALSTCLELSHQTQRIFTRSIGLSTEIPENSYLELVCYYPLYRIIYVFGKRSIDCLLFSYYPLYRIIYNNILYIFSVSFLYNDTYTYFRQD